MFIFIFNLSHSTNTVAQNKSIRGVVTERETGSPLEFVQIILNTIEGIFIKGTVTDASGFYELGGLSKGNYILSFQYIGYETYVDTLTLDQNTSVLVRTAGLRTKEEELEEVLVTDKKISRSTSGLTTIRREQLSRTPTPSLTGDLVSYLQTQPGVVAAGDRGGQLFIRGGTLSENLVLMDGIQVYQPFHIVGMFSVFNEDIISKGDLYAGGFGAKYNGRVSSVLDVRLKNGNLYGQNWSVDISPFVSGVFYEGPLNKGKSSILVSARTSVIEASSGWYLDEQQPLRFNSQLVKYNSTNNQGINCSNVLMRSYDRGKLDYASGDTFRWSNFIGGGTCTTVFPEGAVSFIKINYGASHFSNEVITDGRKERYSDLFRSSFDLNLVQGIGPLRLDYGFFGRISWYKYDISEIFLFNENIREAQLSSGLYATADISPIESLKIDAGLVFGYYATEKFSLEPRFSLQWEPKFLKGGGVNASGGIYRQSEIGIADYRDAGTAFTAWMRVPDMDKLMEAYHALIGWYQPIGDKLFISVESYYKDVRNIPVTVWSSVPQPTSDLIFADSEIYGADAHLDFEIGRFYSSIGYGYLWVEYASSDESLGSGFSESILTYHPIQDQRHHINVLAGLEFNRFSFNLSWVYGAGTPFTRPSGFDSFFLFDVFVPDIREQYGAPRILVDKPFGGRLPDFHRLDASLAYAFFRNSTKIEVQAGVLNGYNWENIFYYDVSTQRKLTQLPFLPFISMKISSL